MISCDGSRDMQLNRSYVTIGAGISNNYASNEQITKNQDLNSRGTNYQHESGSPQQPQFNLSPRFNQKSRGDKLGNALDITIKATKINNTGAKAPA